MYEEFLSSKEYSFLNEYERETIMDQLKRRMCMYEAYFVNIESNIRDACSHYKLGYANKNYTDHTPCIGNFPGFLMTKMPYWERES